MVSAASFSKQPFAAISCKNLGKRKCHLSYSYVSTFLGFLDPLPSYVSMFLVLKILKQKLAFSDPLPLTSAYVIYEWSP